MNEQFVHIKQLKHSLSAIIHQADKSTGVLIVVGGPQYRVGSHRQFVKLSRYLASQGIPSMRLDTSGMGDSEGEKAAFYHQTDDINAAITEFLKQQPHIKQVVLWGLCDGASAILIKLNQHDERVKAIVLLNPWVRQEQSHAKTMLKHYYLKRLCSKAFWKKLLTGSLAFSSSVASFKNTLKATKQSTSNSASLSSISEQNYVNYMLSGWQAFKGKSLVITSANDLTAQEFLLLCNEQPSWQACLAKAQHRVIDEANHTFSTEKWRYQVQVISHEFIESAIAYSQLADI